MFTWYDNCLSPKCLSIAHGLSHRIKAMKHYTHESKYNGLLWLWPYAITSYQLWSTLVLMKVIRKNFKVILGTPKVCCLKLPPTHNSQPVTRTVHVPNCAYNKHWKQNSARTSSWNIHKKSLYKNIMQLTIMVILCNKLMGSKSIF